jgi:hypothetical protein
MYILGPEQVILKVVDRASDAANPWRRPLLQAPRRAHVLTGLYPPEVIRQMMADEFLRQHPSLKPWSQCQTALMALSIEPDGEIAVDLMCEFSPQVQPKETQERTVKRTLELLEEQVGQLRKGLGAKDPTGQLMEKMEAGMAQALVQSRSANVVASIRVKTDANTLGAGLELLRPATQGAQLVAGRTLCANNLKQIGLALHVFADDHGRLPAHAIFSKDGTPLLSWRVALLPTLDMHDLYAQFKLDEPWDSAHNLKLLDRMPAIYAAVPHKSATHFQAFVGKGAVFDGMTGIRWQDIADGNSQTAMIVEAFEPVPWTKPADIDFDAKRPLPKFGKVSPLGFHLLMADASVRFIREVDPDTMRDLILRNDGRVIDVRKIRD